MRPSLETSSPSVHRHSRYGYTQDWVQANIDNFKNSERGNWWSDDSDSSPSVKPGSALIASPTSGISYLVPGSATKAPAYDSKVADQRLTSPSILRSGPSLTDYQPSECELGSESSPTMLAAKSTNPRLPAPPPVPSQKATDVENASPSTPPHFDRTVSEAPVFGSAQHPPGSPPRRSTASIPELSATQKSKKRVPWRGKTCIIALPLDEGSDNLRKVTYLKAEGVSDRLRQWEEQGYSTIGFTLASDPLEPENDASEGQSKAIYPDSVDESRERNSRAYRVSIPDRLEWEAYVARLKEEKLRALGVSFGDDDTSTSTPAVPTMSRNISSQSSSIAISPAIASSIASNIGNFASQASQIPLGGSNDGSRISSAGSQTYQQLAQPHVSHFPRYSVGMPNGNASFNMPYQQSAPAGLWTSQQRHGSRPDSRVMSPAVNEHIQDINTILLPASPVNQNNMSPIVNQDPRAVFANMQKEQARLQAHHLAQQQQQQERLQAQHLVQQQQQARLQAHHVAQQQQQQAALFANASSTPLRPPRQLDEVLPMQYTSQPEIASPIPQGHRKNLSETLQREIHDAEISLTALMMKERDIEKIQTSLATGAETGKNEDPFNPLDDGIDAGLPDAEIETNPSLSNSPFGNISTQNSHQHGHNSKTSVSGLNVNATEFKPKDPVPEVVAFLGHSTSEPDLGANDVEPGQGGRGASHGGFNVEAPVFIPGSAPKRTMPSREFSFSSSGPAFQPDAPVFKPSGSGQAAISNASKPAAADGEVKKIFGNFDYFEVVKPIKKSRAIPIVKPEHVESASDADSDGQEDESGRITQPEGRQKRLRRHDDDGDQVPLFATPPPGTTQAKLNSISPLSVASDAEDDISHLENATHQLKEIIDELPASDVSSLSAEGDLSAPFSFSNAQEAAEFSAALPLVSPPIVLVRNEDPELPHATLHTEEDFPIEPILTASSLPGNGQVQRHTRLDNQEYTSESVSSSVSPDHSIKPQHDHDASEVRPIANEDVRDFGAQPAIDGVTYVDPSLQEINEVMKHLNDEDSDLGVERNPSPWRSRSPIRGPAPGILESTGHRILPPLHLRSDAPSPSPNRLKGPYQYLPPTESESADTADVEMVARNARFSPSYRPSKSDVHRLNSPGSQSISDWDDAILSVDELQFQRKTNFFDNRVDGLIGNIVQQHMGPLEKTLAGIQASLTTLSSRANSRRPRRTLSDEVEHSDADDEDDEEDAASSSRMKSPLRDRKFEKLKTSIQEIATAQQNLAPATQLAEVIEAVKDLKASVQSAPTSTSNIKSIVEEAVGRQLRGKSAPITSSHQSATAEKSQLQIAGLESMLKIAEKRAEDELKARRDTEDALADSQRLLRGALQEAAEQRESAEETERSLAAFHEERHEGLRHTAVLEGSRESLERAAAELSEKNAALEATLEEYRLSSTATLEEYRLSSKQWRAEIEDERTQNKDLNRTINALRSEMDDGIKGRESLRNQISRLQEDMTQMANDVARDQAIRHSKEQDLRSKLDMSGSRLEAEARTRERLEVEIDRLEVQEKEALKARFMLEQVQRANIESEALVSQLRSENHEHQKAIAHLERESIAASESGSLELQRTKSSMQANIEAAEKQIDVMRADLESTTERLQKKIDDAVSDSEAVKARHELMLEEASESRDQALREAAEARETALQEHNQFHERTMDDLRNQQERALSVVLEDKQRSENHLAQRLALADEKITHYTDKVAHLEERLEIAKSAAHAAVQAAQTWKSTSSPSATREPWTKSTGLTEKISPQALRESILVLQEQLQEREGRIEVLEQELSQVDRDAPAKLKDQEIEITWLRELLGVRIDDLEDIINTLSQPTYDSEAVKDAAIRLKANLQMEQQEKERAMAGGQTFPSLATISNLAASPRALPLAAAAAWGNWRKARETPFSSLSAAVNGNPDQTPSRSSPSAQSFLSGLLTPPSTHIRQSPSTSANDMVPRSSSSSKRPLRQYSTPRQSFSAQGHTSPLQKQASPVTPPLMRKASYDQDAQSADFGQDGSGRSGGDEEPFGPSLGSILTAT